MMNFEETIEAERGIGSTVEALVVLNSMTRNVPTRKATFV